jgi:hypothetical protein
MSERMRTRLGRSDHPSPRSHDGRKCKECRKYSRKTFYCAKLLKVLDQNKEACTSFFPRRITRENRTRKI